jgi:hypothetical protein
MNKIKIYFDSPKFFGPSAFKPLNGIVGLYLIFCKTIRIQYPFKKSRLVYIGMSERKTNSIGARLSGHFDGSSKNIGLLNYRKMDSLLFTYINFDVLRSSWPHRIENLESYFILDFVEKYGVYPICNNKTGYDILKNEINTDFIIDWNYFK